LLPRKEGRPVGTRIISEVVETIIQAAIGEIYLVPKRPPMRELARQIAVRCRRQGEQPPTERTIKARVDKIDPLVRARLCRDDSAQETMLATPGKLHTALTSTCRTTNPFKRLALLATMHRFNQDP